MTFNTQIHDRSLSWLGTGTSIKSGGGKLVSWPKKTIHYKRSNALNRIMYTRTLYLFSKLFDGKVLHHKQETLSDPTSNETQFERYFQLHSMRFSWLV